MRKYASIPPRIWQSDIKAVRGDLEAIAVHYHLTTCGHANMIGLYYIPVAYISHEIGCPMEGASKGLNSLIQAGLCSYDFDKDLVWVHDMACDQVAPQLSPKDKRVSGIAGQLAMFPICPITLGFYAKYRLPYHLYDERILEDFESAFDENHEAPSKPLRSQKQEQDQKQDLETETESFGSGNKNSSEVLNTRENMMTSFPIPSSAAQAKQFLIGKGVPASRMDECIRLMMGGNFSPFELEGVLEQSRNAA